MNAPGDGTLAALCRIVESEGEPLATALVESESRSAWGPLVAAGGRASERRDEYALLTESIFEGYLLHYSRGRLLQTTDDDLLLLGGDFLYAYGLTRLAELGDVQAIEDFADLIALCAQLHAGASGGEPDPELIAAIWALTSLAVGSGRWDGYERAKPTVRTSDPQTTQLVQALAAERGREVGLGQELEHALIAFRVAFPGRSRTM